MGTIGTEMQCGVTRWDLERADKVMLKPNAMEADGNTEDRIEPLFRGEMKKDFAKRFSRDFLGVIY